MNEDEVKTPMPELPLLDPNEPIRYEMGSSHNPDMLEVAYALGEYLSLLAKAQRFREEHSMLDQFLSRIEEKDYTQACYTFGFIPQYG